MGQKPDGDPLKLIHILPSKPDSNRFRIQIGSERVPSWIAGLAFVVRIFQVGIRQITSTGQWVGRQGQKGVQFVGTFIRFLKYGILRSCQTIRPWKVDFRGPMAKLFNIIGSASERLKGKGKWQLRRNRRKKIQPPPEPVAQIAPPVLLQENNSTSDVQTVQDQLIAQQQELARVASQMSELQALVLSQQQVLLHLGKELEAAEMRANPQEPLVPRKPKTRTTKVSKSKKSSSQKQPPPNPPLGMEVTG